MSAVADPPIASDASTFRTFLRSAGKLALARQISGLIFVGAVLALPALTTHGISTEFVWTYFAMMTITSLLGFGLERLAGTVTAERGDLGLGTSLVPVLVARSFTLPLAAGSLWVMLRFVGVAVPPAAWWATFLWIVAGLFGPLVFAALRTVGNSTAEPVIMVSVRALQSAALVGLALAGAGVSLLVTTIAAIEVVGVLCAFRTVGGFDVRGAPGVRTLPLRRGAALAGVEVVGLLNLRADLILVGRILGAGPGAVYGLLYRVVDGFSGVVGSAGLWLYAEAANGTEGGEDAQGIRARPLRLLPRLGVALAAVVILAAGPVGSLVPELSGEVGTLRVLVVAFPLLTLNAIELHVRSGRGRNREVLMANTAALFLNVTLCIVLVSTIGLVGGAVALAASELLQAAILMVTASRSERRLVAPALAIALAGATTLAATAAAMSGGHDLLVAVGVVATGCVVAFRVPVRRDRQVVPA